MSDQPKAQRAATDDTEAARAALEPVGGGDLWLRLVPRVADAISAARAEGARAAEKVFVDEYRDACKSGLDELSAMQCAKEALYAHIAQIEAAIRARAGETGRESDHGQ